MAFGIWPRGFASKGSSDAFDIFSGGPSVEPVSRTRQSPTGGLDCAHGIRDTNKIVLWCLLNIWSPIEVIDGGGGIDALCVVCVTATGSKNCSWAFFGATCPTGPMFSTSNFGEMSCQFSPRQKLEEPFHPSVDFQNLFKFRLNSKSITE